MCEFSNATPSQLLTCESARFHNETVATELGNCSTAIRNLGHRAIIFRAPSLRHEAGLKPPPTRDFF